MISFTRPSSCLIFLPAYESHVQQSSDKMTDIGILMVFVIHQSLLFHCTVQAPGYVTLYKKSFQKSDLVVASFFASIAT